MEFKLRHINVNEPAHIRFINIGGNSNQQSLFDNQRNNISENFIALAFIIEHNKKLYNTLFDDVLYLYGKVQRWLTVNDLQMILSMGSYAVNTQGVRLQINIYSSNSNNELQKNFQYFLGSQYLCIREPEDPSNVFTIEKEVKVIEYVDREVIKNVLVPVVTELKDIENCFICDTNKAFVSFGCCSINYCPQCSIKILNRNQNVHNVEKMLT